MEEARCACGPSGNLPCADLTAVCCHGFKVKRIRRDAPPAATPRYDAFANVGTQVLPIINSHQGWMNRCRVSHGVRGRDRRVWSRRGSSKLRARISNLLPSPLHEQNSSQCGQRSMQLRRRGPYNGAITPPLMHPLPGILDHVGGALYCGHGLYSPAITHSANCPRTTRERSSQSRREPQEGKGAGIMLQSPTCVTRGGVRALLLAPLTRAVTL
ncbi:hypothetical protein BC834DRAFT_53988 [Gloeopeniophorella convolvens]|nr:hypothetical protein BC834DRAFT_53988 [Gloeopeniophorella convolvens]